MKSDRSNLTPPDRDAAASQTLERMRPTASDHVDCKRLPHTVPSASTPVWLRAAQRRTPLMMWPTGVHMPCPIMCCNARRCPHILKQQCSKMPYELQGHLRNAIWPAFSLPNRVQLVFIRDSGFMICSLERHKIKESKNSLRSTLFG
eukprot:2876493-Pleurochrysis_carterae.AAC.1